METTPTTYQLCPRCFRAVPSSSGEHYCPNDGTQLLAACPHCQAMIVSPYARFCTTCGKGFYSTPNVATLRKSKNRLMRSSKRTHQLVRKD